MDLSDKLINNRYKIVEKVDDDLLSTIWKALKLTPVKGVTLRFLKKKNNSYRVEDLIRFKRDTTIISGINHPNLADIIEVDEFEDYTYIAKELLEGESLLNFFQRGGRFSFEASLTAVINICHGLMAAHENGIIHGDLNPQNIWFEFLNGYAENLKITGFGFAELKDLTGINNIEDIIRTFGYMSPEASGVINKNIDERSDLYSLGIVFYQMLTGELPYKGENIDSILHRHVAMMPAPPSGIINTIPKDIDRIIFKLLNKDQEDRYQSVEGLLTDLNRVADGEKDFKLASKDKKIKLSFKTGLISRDKELDKLNELYFEALNGKGCICLIAGEAGSGKTRLVDEFRNLISDKNSVFLYGKCFVDENKTPYQVFNSALNEYIPNFKRMSSEQQDDIMDRISSAVGELGEIIQKLNPFMDSLLGEVKPVINLSPEKENERFLDVTSNFICSLGRKSAPVIIFLDDVQWADEGTLSLISEIAYKVSSFPILFLASYRYNEISEEHTLNSIKREHTGIKEIKLNLFNVAELTDFTARLLGEIVKNIPIKLTDYLFEKSKGNPFFAIEIIRQLIEEKIIYRGTERWEFEVNRLYEIDVPDTIIDIVLRRVRLLSDVEKKVLAYGAIIGSKFELAVLYNLCKSLKKETILDIVDKAINLQLLERESKDKEHLLFVHDRIRDAFYKDIDEKDKKNIHLEIARALEQNEKTDYMIFSLAQHYINAGDPEKSMEYAIPAGKISQEQHAYEEAIGYYSLSLKLLEAKGKKDNIQWLEINENLGDVYLASAEYNEAIERYNMILPFIDAGMDKAEIYKQISVAYFGKGDFDKCEEYAMVGLRLLGEQLPSGKIKVILGIIKELVVHMLHITFPGFFSNKEKGYIKDKYKLLAMFALPLAWSYALSDIYKFIYFTLRNLNLAETKMSGTNVIGTAISGYASMCAGVPLFDRALRYHEKALKIRKMLNDQWGIAQSYQLMGYCYEWKGDFRRAIECFTQSSDGFKEIGDIKEYRMSLVGLAQNALYVSDYQKANKINEIFYNIASKSKDDFGLSASWLHRAVYFYLMGDFDKSIQYTLKVYNISHENETWMINCTACILLGRLYYYENNIEESIKYLEEGLSLYDKNNFIRPYTVGLFPSLAEVYILDYLENIEFRRKKKKYYLNRIKKNCRRALKETKSWIVHYGFSLCIYAKYYALIGDYKNAEKYFIRSIDNYFRIEIPYESGKAYYEYGLYLNNIGKIELARAFLQKSYSILKAIDAKYFLKKIVELLGVQAYEETSIERFIDKRRLSSVIDVSQQISSILNIEELLDNIVSKAIEVTGAMRGYLFIFDEEKEALQLRASKNIEEDTGKEQFFKYSQDIVNDVFETGKTVITDDVLKNRDLAKYKDLETLDLKSILCIPITLRGRNIGVFYLGNRLSSSVFSEDDSELLNVFFSQAAISIENAGLYFNLERKIYERTAQLQEAQTQLSRLAETATGVLHNIGNILNSVNISNEEIRSILQRSRFHGLSKANNLLRQHIDKVGKFFASDPKGRLLPEYYFRVESMLKKEYNKISEESGELTKKFIMMRDIISVQQEQARISAFKERVNISNSVDDALKILNESLVKYNVQVEKRYGDTSVIILNKAKLDHVIVNILKNAVEAMVGNSPLDRVISVETGLDNGNQFISISDNGYGIKTENINKIFQYGFTTKEKGHGYGLHSSAELMRELGGEIVVESVSQGKGTTFRLLFPMKR